MSIHTVRDMQRAAEALSDRIAAAGTADRAYILYVLASSDEGRRVLEQAFASLDRYHVGESGGNPWP